MSFRRVIEPVSTLQLYSLDKITTQTETSTIPTPIQSVNESTSIHSVNEIPTISTSVKSVNGIPLPSLPELPPEYSLPQLPPEFSCSKNSKYKFSDVSGKIDYSNESSTSILFGTSITRHINGDRLAPNGKHCINVSKSGARIIDISNMMKDFYDTAKNETIKDIKNVIFSLGTNDVKRYKQDIYKYWHPLKNLINQARSYFGPNINIYFQSLIPMRVLYNYTANNFLGFNKLLREMCFRFKCKYISQVLYGKIACFSAEQLRIFW